MPQDQTPYYTLRVADLDGDGIGDPTPDLILVAAGAWGSQTGVTGAGAVHVFAGRPSWPSVIDLRSNGGDFTVWGNASSVWSQPPSATSMPTGRTTSSSAV